MFVRLLFKCFLNQFHVYEQFILRRIWYTKSHFSFLPTHTYLCFATSLFTHSNLIIELCKNVSRRRDRIVFQYWGYVTNLLPDRYFGRVFYIKLYIYTLLDYYHCRKYFFGPSGSAQVGQPNVRRRHRFYCRPRPRRTVTTVANTHTPFGPVVIVT